MNESNDRDFDRPEAEQGGHPVPRAGDVARGYEPTGNPTVDSVLESLERLDNAPVDEHVGVFESAHEKLRGALADAGNDDDQSS